MNLLARFRQFQPAEHDFVDTEKGKEHAHVQGCQRVLLGRGLSRFRQIWPDCRPSSAGPVLNPGQQDAPGEAGEEPRGHHICDSGPRAPDPNGHVSCIA